MNRGYDAHGATATVALKNINRERVASVEPKNNCGAVDSNANLCAGKPGSQKARSGNELFATLGNGGWVQATSTVSGLRGFWLNYDSGLTYLDGAAAAATAVDEIIPLVAATTEVNVANPNPGSQVVTLHLVNESGTDLGKME